MVEETYKSIFSDSIIWDDIHHRPKQDFGYETNHSFDISSKLKKYKNFQSVFIEDLGSDFEDFLLDFLMNFISIQQPKRLITYKGVKIIKRNINVKNLFSGSSELNMLVTSLMSLQKFLLRCVCFEKHNRTFCFDDCEFTFFFDSKNDTLNKFYLKFAFIVDLMINSLMICARYKEYALCRTIFENNIMILYFNIKFKNVFLKEFKDILNFIINKKAVPFQKEIVLKNFIYLPLLSELDLGYFIESTQLFYYEDKELISKHISYMRQKVSFDKQVFFLFEEELEKFILNKLVILEKKVTYSKFDLIRFFTDKTNFYSTKDQIEMFNIFKEVDFDINKVDFIMKKARLRCTYTHVSAVDLRFLTIPTIEFKILLYFLDFYIFSKFKSSEDSLFKRDRERAFRIKTFLKNKKCYKFCFDIKKQGLLYPRQLITLLIRIFLKFEEDPYVIQFLSILNIVLKDYKIVYEDEEIETKRGVGLGLMLSIYNIIVILTINMIKRQLKKEGYQVKALYVLDDINIFIMSKYLSETQIKDIKEMITFIFQGLEIPIKPDEMLILDTLQDTVLCSYIFNDQDTSNQKWRVPIYYRKLTTSFFIKSKKEAINNIQNHKMENFHYDDDSILLYSFQKFKKYRNFYLSEWERVLPAPFYGHLIAMNFPGDITLEFIHFLYTDERFFQRRSFTDEEKESLKYVVYKYTKFFAFLNTLKINNEYFNKLIDSIGELTKETKSELNSLLMKLIPKKYYKLERKKYNKKYIKYVNRFRENILYSDTFVTEDQLQSLYFDTMIRKKKKPFLIPRNWLIFRPINDISEFVQLTYMDFYFENHDIMPMTYFLKLLLQMDFIHHRDYKLKIAIANDKEIIINGFLYHRYKYAWKAFKSIKVKLDVIPDYDTMLLNWILDPINYSYYSWWKFYYRCDFDMIPSKIELICPNYKDIIKELSYAYEYPWVSHSPPEIEYRKIYNFLYETMFEEFDDSKLKKFFRIFLHEKINVNMIKKFFSIKLLSQYFQFYQLDTFLYHVGNCIYYYIEENCKEPSKELMIKSQYEIANIFMDNIKHVSMVEEEDRKWTFSRRDQIEIIDWFALRDHLFEHIKNLIADCECHCNFNFFSKKISLYDLTEVDIESSSEEEINFLEVEDEITEADFKEPVISEEEEKIYVLVEDEEAFMEIFSDLNTEKFTFVSKTGIMGTEDYIEDVKYLNFNLTDYITINELSTEVDTSITVCIIGYNNSKIVKPIVEIKDIYAISIDENPYLSYDNADKYVIMDKSKIPEDYDYTIFEISNFDDYFRILTI